jgi:hypothetical protein
MAVILLDTDKINNELVPLAENKLGNINSASDISKKVVLENGESNWTTISNQLEECANQTKKYIEWLKNINITYVNTINNGIETINSAKIEEIDKCKLVVK